ncbi:F-box/FBD/LRR-repeat protein At3g26920-like [Triticum dicoccoides]|uniref:F-box/FBD/LRR-repeat protein At3g26920-like n=1 Tax=Triticum dicoccoides TaxID=85692 RepID=UPI0018900B2D|nr:F-box/FBD/LRR-repeat protein At3g26920-like [Triticum dicoccoides]
MEDAAAAAVPGAHASASRRSDDRQAPLWSPGPREQQRSVDDLISHLPDDVLGAVVSLLPTKDGARTQVLSRRWRPLWRSSAAPLNLSIDRRFCAGDARKHVAVVSRILSDHPGPARRFSLRRAFPPGQIDRWLRSGSLARLQDLEIAYTKVHGDACHPMPPAALCFAPTLRAAKFGGCEFPELTAPSPKFPRLKQLTLCRVSISEDSLHGMLSGCIALESLSLDRNIGVGRLCISSPTVRRFSFSPHRDKQGILTCQELLVQDVPCLERLILHDSHIGPTTIRITGAPKLELLGLLSHGISTLKPGTTVLQKTIDVSLTTIMHKVKILVVDSIGPNLDAIVGLLKCFTFLERLYVISHPQEDMNNVRKYDPLDPIECLELHLKKVVLKNYDGNRTQVIHFAQFFVLNAKVLKEMEIGVVNRCNSKWMRFQRKRLQVGNRASRDAQIELKWDTKKSFKYHGFSEADPFDMSSC